MAETRIPPVIAALSFEDALAELERIVRQLEEGKAKLDDAIGSYERGTLLRRHCEAKLREAQAKIDRITVGPDGTLGLQPTGIE
jgi:exodeoxyribonuclease VII small subunit